MSDKAIQSAITGLLKAEGFKKKGTTWYLESDEAVCVLNLQKSTWGAQYYINLGVLVKGLKDVPFPKEYECHVRVRLCSLVHNRRRFEKYLDFADATFSTIQKVEKICEAIKNEGLPMLLACRTLNGIKDTLRRKKGFLIDSELRNFLMLDGDDQPVSKSQAVCHSTPHRVD